jgi:carbamoyltransferase
MMTGQHFTAGLSGASSQACVALVAESARIGVCEQERVTRIRRAGSNSTGLPDEALDLLLDRFGSTRSDVVRYAIAEAGGDTLDGRSAERLDHHLAHACTAYLSSPFTSATIVVCDHDAPRVSVWRGSEKNVTRVDWLWSGIGFTDLYSACAAVVGFPNSPADQRLEALARLAPDHRDSRVDRLFRGNEFSLDAKQGWQSEVEGWIADAMSRGGVVACANLAAALQARITELFLSFLERVQRVTGDQALCLAGSLFYNSSINTAAKQSKLFANVFVPIDPGNPGLAVGTALHADHRSPESLSPFLGPSYDAKEIKATLDNCKLRYDWKGDDAVVDLAVSALRKGMLVAWFEGGMEWGPRALGARSILASPFSPYVLENLNGFLKRRQSWRGYGLSVADEAIGEHFDGPASAPFMESDYRPRDPKTFRHVLPAAGSTVRVHGADRRSPPRFRKLIEAFGAVTGVPCVVNTSFNGFHEPIVCSPRDAVRVFYGSGVDMLVLEQFVLVK